MAIISQKHKFTDLFCELVKHGASAHHALDDKLVEY